MASTGVHCQFVQGSIKRIQLKNFMTYSELDFQPGPRMNVIIGPNGTGKSTIMCAICLGLGGKPGLIGRATQIKDYVKLGQQAAHIFIELSAKDGKTCIIGRKITKMGSSSYTLNGNQVKANQVEEVVCKYDIKMSNLCQFLPQDRVVEFVKMNPQELLENTEKAAGEKGMFEDHYKLKDWHLKSKELEVACGRLKDDLDKESQRRLRLEEQVKNYRDREAFMQKVELLEQKKGWIEYETKRKEYLAIKNQKVKEENELSAIRLNLEPMQKEVQNVTRGAKDCDSKISKAMEDVKQQKTGMQSKVKELNKEDEKARKIISHFNEKLKLEAERNVRLHELKQQLAYFESELANVMDTEADSILQLNGLNQQMQTLNSEISQIQDKISKVSVEMNTRARELEGVKYELKHVQDVGQQKLEFLRQVDRHAYDAVLWLRANQQKFKQTIHEPIMTVINVRDSTFAKYIENSIPFKDLVAFVCEDSTDLELFMSTLRDGQNLRINVVLGPKECSTSDFRYNVSIDAIRQYGFRAYLKEMFEAPDAVLGYLCKQYSFHRIPVGNEDTKKLVEQVIKNTPFTKFFTENHQYAVKVSMYGAREQSTRCYELPPARYLTFNHDIGLANNLKKTANEMQSKLDEAVAEKKELHLNESQLTRDMEQFKRTKREILTKRDAKKNLQGKIEQKKESIRNFEEDTIDVEVEKAKGKEELLKVSYNKVDVLWASLQFASKMLKLSKHRADQTCKLCSFMFQKSKLEADFNIGKKTILHLERSVHILQTREAEAQRDARMHYEKAKKKMGRQNVDELTRSIEMGFPSLQDDDLEALMNEIISLRAQAECLLNTDKSVLVDYETWKKNIESLDDAICKKNEALANHQEEMEVISQRWLPPLQKLVNEINLRFRHYFASLNCAGEVSLSTGENEKDYSKYGICIKVKYRATDQLRELTSQYQSGGEKSVATILYLLALQEFIKLPFCCVDEINQGMDSTNERRVFNMMTQTICQENRCQYFVVTPKLLPDLEFGPHTTIHCIQRSSIAIKQDQCNPAEL